MFYQSGSTMKYFFYRVLATIRLKWTARVKIRIPLSCPCPAGQTDTGLTFSEKSRQNPDTGQNRGRQNPDSEYWQNQDTGQTPDRTFRKIRRRTGPRQCCTLNSGHYQDLTNAFKSTSVCSMLHQSLPMHARRSRQMLIHCNCSC